MKRSQRKLSFRGNRGFYLKLDAQGQGGGRILDVDRQWGEGSWKLDNFHGLHMCIISKMIDLTAEKV